jgi:hypothetical protein
MCERSNRAPQGSGSLFRNGDGHYTRPVSPEEIALSEKFKDALVPLCSVRRCEKVAGHDGEHGPVRFTFERLT